MSVEMIRSINHPNYNVRYSDEDQEWVATSPSYPSLSWLAESPEEAIQGLTRIIDDVEVDLHGPHGTALEA